MKELTHENIHIQPDIQMHFLTYQDSNLLVNNHWHNSLEILLIKSGKMNIWVNDHLAQYGTNEICIINSRDIHATKCIEPTIVQLLQIPYSLLKTSIPDIEDIRFEPDIMIDSEQKNQTLAILLGLLNELGVVYAAKETGYALKFSSLVYELLYILVSNCQIAINPSIKKKNNINNMRLTAIMNYVKNNYSQSLSLKEAASAVSLNPEYFCRFFKKNMGITFLDYVNEVRMSHVIQDIINTEKPITEILSIHGFTNYKLFLNMFHEKYGCTPLQMRKQQINFLANLKGTIVNL